MSFYHITVSSFVLSFLPLLTAQQCYWPDGSDAPAAYKPCANGRGACCYDIDPEYHDLCYDNGFCYSLLFGSVYRGACTNQSWNDGNGCASQCLDFNAGSFALLTSCANRNLCCGAAENVSNCCNEGGGFFFSNATFMTFQQQTSTAVVTVSITVAPAVVTATTTVAAISSTGAVIGKECSQDRTALGAGLGAPLGLALLLITGYIVHKLTTGKRKEENPELGNPQRVDMPHTWKKKRQNIMELPESGAVRELPSLQESPLHPPYSPRTI